MAISDTIRRHATEIWVWLARISAGCVFIISGWAKAIDPWGFVIKVREYLSVWDWELPAELIVTGCVTLSCVEFSTGVLVATGAFKRFSVWVASAIMLFMLPLTAYIAIADPVTDCGCFGDFIVVSNWVTLLKNIALSGILVFLIIFNKSVAGLFPPSTQWMLVAVSLAYPLYLAFVGYNVQPVVDFRPYRTGTLVFSPSDSSESEEEFIYEKNGKRKTFSIDNLPDSTWTFVDMKESGGELLSMGVYDSNGDDVSDDLADWLQDMLILIIPNPDIEYLSRAHYVNGLYDYASRHDTRMIAIVGDSREKLEEWKEWIRPRFDVYTAEDTSLEQLARGFASLVFVCEGIIKWKRTLLSLDADLPESTVEGNALEEIKPVDDGKLHLFISGIYLLSVIGIYLLGQSTKFLRRFARTKPKND